MIGFGFAFHQTFDFSELATNFFDHLHGSIPDRRHRNGGDQKGQRATDENTDQYFWIRQEQCKLGLLDFHGFNKSRNNGKGCKRCRADRKAFPNGRCGITHFV